MNKSKSTPKTKGENLKIKKETLKDLDTKGQDPKGGIILQKKTQTCG